MAGGRVIDKTNKYTKTKPKKTTTECSENSDIDIQGGRK